MTPDLTVKEHYPNDTGRGIIRVSKPAMNECGLDPGDIAQITGADSTLAKVWRRDSSEDGYWMARLDPYLRDNAGVTVGDTVTLESVSPTPATAVTLTPINGRDILGEKPAYQSKLEHRPVLADSQLPFPYARYTDTTIYRVTDTTPTGPVVIDADTDITVR